MKYLKRFNESLSDDFEDYLYSLFEKEPNQAIKGDDWFFGCWTNISTEDLQKLKSPRFQNLVVLTEVVSNWVDILVVSKEYYEKMSDWKVSNLKWDKHPMAHQMPGFSAAFDQAKIVHGLPNKCSLIKGLRSGGGLEFWPQKQLGEPLYVDTEVELQALIYKYICDAPIKEDEFQDRGYLIFEYCLKL